MTTARRLILLGSTGSIGRQTIDVAQSLNALADRGEPGAARVDMVALAAGSNGELLLEQARQTGARALALTNPGADGPALVARAAREGRTLLLGPDAAERLVIETQAEIVLSAIVGAAGLPATLAAARLGRDIALANKETLVAAGSLVVPLARASGSRLLPVDSEHSAVWQCFDRDIVPPCALGGHVRRVTLTASGGPFRALPAEQVYNATPEMALNHPTWSMGPKVTVDSASLMNKALELIEAHWLFGLPSDRLDAVIHPQSIVHALVEFVDGSVLAQLGAPDMRTPIQCALTFPRRAAGRSARLDLASLSRLDFQPVDHERFPALRLANEVIDRPLSTAGAVLNGANEAAVEAFLARRAPFGMIPRLAREALAHVGDSPVRDLADVAEADAEARRFVASRLTPAHAVVAAPAARSGAATA